VQQSYSAPATGFLMHFPPQHLWVSPAPPLRQHPLPQHTSPAGQLRQVPSLHGMVPSGQRQFPPEHVLPPVQETPHAPQ
jgi:hypothetical protein